METRLNLAAVLADVRAAIEHCAAAAEGDTTRAEQAVDVLSFAERALAREVEGAA